MSAGNALLIPRIESRIQVIRGLRVMLDVDLAELYGVQTKRLNEQVKRNRERFPADFLFQLTLDEKAEVVANCDHLQKLKFSKVLPFAFTEHGAVQVMTMKVSKGLEFPVVPLPGVGHMPAAGEDEKEAARVFYVAATRATQRLVIGVGGDGGFGVRLA